MSPAPPAWPSMQTSSVTPALMSTLSPHQLAMQQQHLAETVSKTPVHELIVQIKRLPLPTSCTFVLSLLERCVGLVCVCVCFIKFVYYDVLLESTTLYIHMPHTNTNIHTYRYIQYVLYTHTHYTGMSGHTCLAMQCSKSPSPRRSLSSPSSPTSSSVSRSQSRWRGGRTRQSSDRSPTRHWRSYR